MRKERNSFFQESQYNQGYFYNNQMPQMPQMEASSSFYMNQNMNNPYSDFQTRLSRLERQVNRLESRINKIENDGIKIPSEEIENNTNMYMI